MTIEDFLSETNAKTIVSATSINMLRNHPNNKYFAFFVPVIEIFSQIIYLGSGASTNLTLAHSP